MMTTEDREVFMAVCKGCQRYASCRKWRQAINVCQRCWRNRRGLYDNYVYGIRRNR